MKLGYDKPLYVLPFDHRASFSKEMFGWEGPLTASAASSSAATRATRRSICG